MEEVANYGIEKKIVFIKNIVENGCILENTRKLLRKTTDRKQNCLYLYLVA